MPESYLARCPSWVFALMYLLMIPAFAGIFASFGDEFYQETARHEEYIKSDAESILSALHQSMVIRFAEEYGSTVHPNIPSINWNHISLSDLQYSPGTFSFALGVGRGGDKDRLPTTALPLRLSLFWPRTNPSDSSAKMYALGTELGMAGASLMRELFPIDRAYSKEQQERGMGFVVIPDSLERQLLAWEEAWRGFPARSADQYWGFLYLSAVTIATVGFGDIVPVTTRARLWIAAEAVLGIIVVGLFLNSLSFRSRDE